MYPSSSHRPSNSFKSCNKLKRKKKNTASNPAPASPRKGGFLPGQKNLYKMPNSSGGRTGDETPSLSLEMHVPPASYQHHLLSALGKFFSCYSVGAPEDTKPSQLSHLCLPRSPTAILGPISSDHPTSEGVEADQTPQPLQAPQGGGGGGVHPWQLHAGGGD